MLDCDDIVAMAIASILAWFSLMQGSVAVVIGAVLVAPVIGPMLGAGLAFTQENTRLVRAATGASASRCR
jgi:uncharacterized membrane protein